MWVITYKGKPARIGTLMKQEQCAFNLLDDMMYLAGPSRKDVVGAYIGLFGFTWRERAKGVDVMRVEV